MNFKGNNKQNKNLPTEKMVVSVIVHSCIKLFHFFHWPNPPKVTRKRKFHFSPLCGRTKLHVISVIKKRENNVIFHPNVSVLLQRGNNLSDMSLCCKKKKPTLTLRVSFKTISVVYMLSFTIGYKLQISLSFLGKRNRKQKKPKQANKKCSCGYSKKKLTIIK